MSWRVTLHCNRAEAEALPESEDLFAFSDAPPVIVSTRSMASEGMVLMSTTSEALPGVARRPSSKTRLRFAPRPRSETVAPPGVSVAVG